MHGIRKLMSSTRTGSWSAEEITTLKDLVNEKGFRWKEIGLLMGKLGGKYDVIYI